ncbi:thiamine ABC transporter substrate-binding protein [Myceligenerans cantabricum]
MSMSYRSTTTTVAAAALLLAGCTGGPDDEQDSAPPAAPGTVTVVTHGSFPLDEGLLERFEQQSGLTVEVNAADDPGALAGRLVQAGDTPPGDVVLGVDNTLAPRLAGEGVTEVNYLWPIGTADVCVNADTSWFTEQGLPVPRSLDDLVSPRYQGLLVVPDPATSPLGLAFLLAVVDEYGDVGMGGYLTGLRENDVKTASSWEDAYTDDFSGAEGDGDRPLVVSYSTSPAGTAGQDGKPTTAAVLETCFRHEEYAGLLAGAANRDGGKDLLEFLVSDAVQQNLPASMSLYPADAGARPPEEFRPLPRPEDPHELDPEELTEHREPSIEAWHSIMDG